MPVALAFVVTVAAIGLVAPGASAGRSHLSSLLPSCGAETYPFAQWGDSDAYCAFPNLGLESGTAGWTLTGKASVVNDNEPWHVSGPGTHALELGPGATATSGPLPISLVDPWVRFFAKNSAANGSLSVQVVFYGLLGNLTGLLNYGSLSIADFASWEPTQPISSVLALPLLTSTAEVRLTNEAKNGNWLVDDLYLDPCLAKLGR